MVLLLGAPVWAQPAGAPPGDTKAPKLEQAQPAAARPAAVPAPAPVVADPQPPADPPAPLTAPQPQVPPVSDQPPQLPPGHPPVAPITLPPGHPPVSGHPPLPLPPVPLAPPALFPSQLEDEHDEELVGFHHGHLFIRDPHDDFRVYPGALLMADFYSAPGAPDFPATQDGSFVKPSFLVRRVKLQVSGELFERLAFTGGIELGGEHPGETSYVGPTTARFAPVTASGQAAPSEVLVSYRFRDWLSVSAGQMHVPFSMSNRTRDDETPFMERNVAIRSFVVPHERDVGVMVWGELPQRLFAYEVGVFSGDGHERAFVDDQPDFVGRIFARPLQLAGHSLFHKQAQIGISARHGQRDQGFVGYDYPTLSTGQGFVLWQPGYVDSFDRVTHVLPSGAQNAIGGELRLPVELPHGRGLELRAEAYYVVNQTREAVEGFQLTNTERFGRVKGIGWYVQGSAWLCGDAFVTHEPGLLRPLTVDLHHDEPVKRGLELLAIAAGVNANYSGATREESQPDANTPVADITVYQFGGGLQYWYGHNFRAALNYMAHFTPDSGDSTLNQAVVPANVFVDSSGGVGVGHFGQELSLRLQAGF